MKNECKECYYYKVFKQEIENKFRYLEQSKKITNQASSNFDKHAQRLIKMLNG